MQGVPDDLYESWLRLQHAVPTLAFLLLLPVLLLGSLIEYWSQSCFHFLCLKRGVLLFVSILVQNCVADHLERLDVLRTVSDLLQKVLESLIRYLIVSD